MGVIFIFIQLINTKQCKFHLNRRGLHFIAIRKLETCQGIIDRFKTKINMMQTICIQIKSKNMQVITEWQPEKNGLTISLEKNSCFNLVFETPMLSVVSTALIR
jgi:hypothetical protein